MYIKNFYKKYIRTYCLTDNLVRCNKTRVFAFSTRKINSVGVSSVGVIVSSGQLCLTILRAVVAL